MIRCMGCMCEYNDNLYICPNCGYVRGQEKLETNYMEPESIMRGRYIIGRVLGAGGFGITYLCWDALLEKKVAIKEYMPSGLSTRMPGNTFVSIYTGDKKTQFETGKQRFLKEAEILAKFNSVEGIVIVYDFFEENNTAYMIMEYIEGVTFKEKSEQGKLAAEEALNLILPVIAALKAVHSEGIIHRDISPDNIYITHDGKVKLLDFGSARYSTMDATNSLSVILKPGYAPIEQYSSHGDQGPWTDIYALAATYYKMTTGIVPEESMERDVRDRLKPLSKAGVKASTNVEHAIMTSLNIHKKDRPQTMEEFESMLTDTNSKILHTKGFGKLPFISKAGLALILLTISLLVITSIANKPLKPIDEETEVPNILNKYIDEADTILKEKDLFINITDKMNDERVEEGLVVQQTPIGGRLAKIKSAVDAVISGGKETNTVHDFTHMYAEKAIKALAHIGFEINTVEKYSDEAIEGTIISQDVQVDTEIPLSTPITITVSKGRENDNIDRSIKVSVPDIVGKDFEEAKDELLQSELYIVKSDMVYHEEIPYGAIVSQSPADGIKLNKGDAVFVVISLGKAKVRIPDVQYKHEDAAKQILAEHGLGYSIEYAQDDMVAQNHVISQDPGAKYKTSYGSVIKLIVNADKENDADSKVNITLDYTNISLNVGENVKLTADITGYDGNIIWKSSNENSVTITDDGEVTAISYGSAVITAAIGGKVAVCNIMVYDETAINLPTTLTMRIGQELQLDEGLFNNDNITIKVSNSKVAVLSAQDNILIAISSGITTIMVAIGDKSYYRNIIVEEPKEEGPPEPEYIKIEKFIGKQKSNAISLLKNAGVKYTLEEDYHTTTAVGAVYRITYTGYDDENYYYFEAGKTVTLYISLGRKIEYVTIPKFYNYTEAQVGELLTKANLKYSVQRENTDFQKDIVYKIDYSGYEDDENYYIDKSQKLVIYVSLGKIVTEKTPPPPPPHTPETTTASKSQPPPAPETTTAPKPQPPPTPETTTAPKSQPPPAPETTTAQAPQPEPIAVTAVELTIMKNPDRMIYIPNEEFDPNGLVLEVLYSDGTKKQVTNGYESKYNFSNVGSANVSISYEGVKVILKVTVERLKVIGISLEKEPNKLEYYAGEPIDPTGMILTLTYNNGTTKATSDINDFAFSYDHMSAGKKTVTVSVGSNQATFVINVLNIEIELDHHTLSMYVHGRATISFTANYSSPNIQATWTVDNNSVVSIEYDGKYCYITANDVGYAVVTASYGNATDECLIIVTHDEITDGRIIRDGNRTDYHP